MMDNEIPYTKRRMGTINTRPSWAFLLLLFTVVAILTLQIKNEKSVLPIWPDSGRVIGVSGRVGKPTCVGFFKNVPERKMVKSIKDFGGIGDGKTSNTAAFWRAMSFMESWQEKGGAQLNVPRGRWVTGSFNLTSNFTLFLEEGAVILGSQVCKF